MSKLELSKTSLKAWPYSVHLPSDPGRDTMQAIHDWLNSQNIRYQYSTPRHWYLKNDIDATAFVLRWS